MALVIVFLIEILMVSNYQNKFVNILIGNLLQIPELNITSYSPKASVSSETADQFNNPTTMDIAIQTGDEDSLFLEQVSSGTTSTADKEHEKSESMSHCPSPQRESRREKVLRESRTADKEHEKSESMPHCPSSQRESRREKVLRESRTADKEHEKSESMPHCPSPQRESRREKVLRESCTTDKECEKSESMPHCPSSQRESRREKVLRESCTTDKECEKSESMPHCPSSQRESRREKVLRESCTTDKKCEKSESIPHGPSSQRKSRREKILRESSLGQLGQLYMTLPLPGCDTTSPTSSLGDLNQYGPRNFQNTPLPPATDTPYSSTEYLTNDTS